MKFQFIGEGLTDYIVIRNILIGFFNDKNLTINRLLPKDMEPVGWGNVLNYLSTLEFQDSFDFADYIIVQIDTDRCEDWNEGIKNIGSEDIAIIEFIEKVKEILVKKIGAEFYTKYADKILFAVCIHEIECWLLPFIADMPAHRSKIVGCLKTAEQVANKRGYSLNQKNYEEGKHYEDLSRDMKNHKQLARKYSSNPSLRIFIEMLKTAFPATPPPQPEAQEPEQP